MSSSNFRNLHLPDAEMKRSTWWLKKSGSDFLILGEMSPLDLDGSVVTVAGMLELIILERERITMMELGLAVTELDIRFE